MVIALIAENTGHVKAVAEMTGTDLDQSMGRAIAADGIGSVIATAVGGPPDHHLRREHRRHGRDPGLLDRRLLVAAVVAILFGFSPKFGAVVSATPGGVLGGITVVLYGMIGLLGAKIWKENGVDFGKPVNLVPVSAGIIIGIGNVSLQFSEDFVLSGIALGTIVTVGVYHLANALAPKEFKDDTGGAVLIVDEPGIWTDGDNDPAAR